MLPVMPPEMAVPTVELIKEAGSNKVTLSNTSSAIYGKLKENSEVIEKLKTMLRQSAESLC